ncbi:MAG: peptidoglycan-binding domain-containing protein [Candidatus Omnitrophota bacterium]
MKNYLVVLVAVFLVFSIFGCSKKDTSLEQMQEPMSMDMLTAINATTPEFKPAVSEMPSPAVQTTAPVGLEANLPPLGSSKPTTRDIQTALKNAGYYTGAIDGKIGPMSKKAIEAFQKANNLKADGKVGSKTWAVLSKHLSASASEPVSKEKTVSLRVR